MKFVATKIGMTTISFSPPLLLLFWIRDLGWVKIRIRDPGKTSRIRNTDTVAYLWLMSDVFPVEIWTAILGVPPVVGGPQQRVLHTTKIR